jgi:hypothetical protein
MAKENLQDYVRSLYAEEGGGDELQQYVRNLFKEEKKTEENYLESLEEIKPPAREPAVPSFPDELPPTSQVKPALITPAPEIPKSDRQKRMGYLAAQFKTKELINKKRKPFLQELIENKRKNQEVELALIMQKPLEDVPVEYQETYKREREKRAKDFKDYKRRALNYFLDVAHLGNYMEDFLVNALSAFGVRIPEGAKKDLKERRDIIKRAYYKNPDMMEAAALTAMNEFVLAPTEKLERLEEAKKAYPLTTDIARVATLFGGVFRGLFNYTQKKIRKELVVKSVQKLLPVTTKNAEKLSRYITPTAQMGVTWFGIGAGKGYADRAEKVVDAIEKDPSVITHVKSIIDESLEATKAGIDLGGTMVAWMGAGAVLGNMLGRLPGTDIVSKLVKTETFRGALIDFTQGMAEAAKQADSFKDWMRLSAIGGLTEIFFGMFTGRGLPHDIYADVISGKRNTETAQSLLSMMDWYKKAKPEATFSRQDLSDTVKELLPEIDNKTAADIVNRAVEISETLYPDLKLKSTKPKLMKDLSEKPLVQPLKKPIDFEPKQEKDLSQKEKFLFQLKPEEVRLINERLVEKQREQDKEIRTDEDLIIEPPPRKLSTPIKVEGVVFKDSVRTLIDDLPKRTRISVGKLYRSPFLTESEETFLRELIAAPEARKKNLFVAGKRIGLIGKNVQLREAKLIAKERIERNKRIRGMINEIKNVSTEKMDIKTKDAINALREEVDWSRISSKTSNKLMRLASEYGRQLEENNVTIPDKALDILKRLSKSPVRLLSEEDITAIHQSIKALEKIEYRKKESAARARKSIFMRYKKGILASLSKRFPPGTGAKEIYRKGEARIGKLQRAIDWLRGIKLDLADIDVVTRLLDGKDKGFLYDVLKNKTSKGENESIDYELEARDKIKKYFKQNPGFNKYLEEIIKFEGNVHSLTRDQLIQLYMKSFNEKDLSHILNGGVFFRQYFNLKGAEPIRISPQELDNILKKVTDKDKDFAEFLWNEIYEPQYERINKIWKSLHGYDLPKEDFYTAIDVYSHAISRNQMNAETAAYAEKKYGNSNWVTFDKGMLKSRVLSETPIFLDGIMISTLKSLRQNGLYIGQEKPFYFANRILNDKEIKEKLIKAFGADKYEYLQKYLRDGIGAAGKLDKVEEGVNFLRNNLATAYLVSPGVMLKQFASWANFVASKPAVANFLPESFFKTIKNLKKVKMYWTEKMPLLKERSDRGPMIEVREIKMSNKARRNLMEENGIKNLKDLRDFLMGGVGFCDEITVLSIAEACKSYVMNKYPDMDIREQEVLWLDLAETSIRRTQIAGSPLDMAGILRSRNQLTRVFTLFHSAMNKILNTHSHIWLDYVESQRTPKDKMNYLVRAGLLFGLNALWIGSVNYIEDKIINYFAGKEPDREEQTYHKAIEEYGYSLSKTIFGMFPFIRDVENIVASRIKYGRWYGLTLPFFRPIEDAVRGSGEAIAGAMEKDTDKIKENIGDAMGGISVLFFGLPFYPLYERYKDFLEKPKSKAEQERERRKEAIKRLLKKRG